LASTPATPFFAKMAVNAANIAESKDQTNHVIGSSLLRLNGDEVVRSFAVHQQQRGTGTRSFHPGANIGARLHRLVIDFEDDVTLSLIHI